MRTAFLFALSALLAFPVDAGGLGGGAFAENGLSGFGRACNARARGGAEGISPIQALKDDSYVWVEGVNFDGASNATLSNGDFIDPAYNQGSHPDLDPASSAFAPIYATNILAGNPVATFDGVSDVLPLQDADAADFIWETGHFEIVILFRADTGGVPRPLVGNTFTGSNLGFMLQAHSSDVGRFFITTGLTTACVVSTVATITPLTWTVLGARGDSGGTRCDISPDLTTYQTAAPGASYVTGSAAFIASIMSDAPTVSTQTDGAVAFVAIWDRELTAGERGTIRTHLNNVWGQSL